MDILARKLIENYAANELRNGFNFVGIHIYNDEKGNLLYFKIRLKNPYGRKWIRPFHFNEDKKDWVMSEPVFSNGKPLYQLKKIKDCLDTDVWLHEGETCVEAMEKYNFIATTSGSSSSIGVTDLTPLRNRKVNIWPDNNSVGFNYAVEATKKLIALGCTVRWVDTSQLNLPDGGDIVDWLTRKPCETEDDVKNIKEDIYSLPLIEPNFSDITSDEEVKNYGDSKRSTDAAYINYRNASVIEIKPYDWLWVDRFARGKVSMLSGHPGLGKSQASASMAANITRGRAWPDKTKCAIGRVIFLSAEDDAADTIVPRLKAADADLTLIDIIDSVVEVNEHGVALEGQFNLVTDMAALEQLLIKLENVAVIFIDPITAYLGNTDDHKNSRVRSVLSPLAKLAEKYNVAIICVSHHNKSGSQEALLRVVGSIGFVAASRAAFAIVKDKEDENRRLFLPLKNNIGNDKTGLAFTIEPVELDGGIKTSRIVWSDEVVTVTADEAMSSSMDDEHKSAVDEASEFLSDILKNGLMYVKEIMKLANSENISEKALRNAKKKLGVKIGRKGFGKGGGSFWYL